MAELKQIVKIYQDYLDGNKSVFKGLMKIKGVGFMFSNAICNILELDKDKKIGELSEKEIESINKVLEDPTKQVPVWMLNRRNDYESGNNLHLMSSKLKLNHEMAIKRLKQVKSYRGLRHAWGLPLRGQRTRAHFRKGSAVGVSKKSQVQPAKKKEAAPAKKAGGKK